MQELITIFRSLCLFAGYTVILILLTELLYLSDTFLNVSRMFGVGIISMAVWMMIQLGIDLNNLNS